MFLGISHRENHKDGVKVGKGTVGFNAAELGSLGGKLGSFWFTLATE